MIRDFAGISKSRLIDEIKELKRMANEDRAPKGVSIDAIEAIDAVRQIGNIGAHMEADINIIVEVDPKEAEELIGLIELLFEEWYVARAAREQRFARLKGIADEKAALKAAGKSPNEGLGLADKR